MDALGYSGGLGSQVADNTLISYFPLPSMPFHTHVNVIFESGKGEQGKKSVDPIDKNTPVESLKLVDQRYAYNPDPNRLRTPTGQIIDFVVA